MPVLEYLFENDLNLVQHSNFNLDQTMVLKVPVFHQNDFNFPILPGMTFSLEGFLPVFQLSYLVIYSFCLPFLFYFFCSPLTFHLSSSKVFSLLSERDRKGERERERNIDVTERNQSATVLYMPRPGIEPATWACASTRN